MRTSKHCPRLPALAGGLIWTKVYSMKRVGDLFKEFKADREGLEDIRAWF